MWIILFLQVLYAFNLSSISWIFHSTHSNRSSLNRPLILTESLNHNDLSKLRSVLNQTFPNQKLSLQDFTVAVNDAVTRGFLKPEYASSEFINTTYHRIKNPDGVVDADALVDALRARLAESGNGAQITSNAFHHFLNNVRNAHCNRNAGLSPREGFSLFTSCASVGQCDALLKCETKTDSLRKRSTDTHPKAISAIRLGLSALAFYFFSALFLILVLLYAWGTMTTSLLMVIMAAAVAIIIGVNRVING